jgi:hypothetical protein
MRRLPDLTVMCAGPLARAARSKENLMSGLEWFFSFAVVILYFALLFFFGIRTFQRGYLMLGVLGIFLPFLWLVGGLLPDRHIRPTA